MITRIVDGLGRIALPVEFRHELKIRDGSKLNMTLENGAIVLRPSNMEHLCSICGMEKDEALLMVYETRICRDCAAVIASESLTEMTQEIKDCSRENHEEIEEILASEANIGNHN